MQPIALILLTASAAVTASCSEHPTERRSTPPPAANAEPSAEPWADSAGAGRSQTPRASDPRPGKLNRSPQLADELRYFDGPIQRSLWVSPDCIAELRPAAASRSAVLAADPSAQELPQRGAGARLWRLSGGRTIDVCQRIVLEPGTPCVSPLLHEGSTVQSAVRALPGGVLISLDPDWSDARARDWLAARGLAIDVELIAPPRSYRIIATPGIASLELANSLHADPDVVSATPEFWMQSTTR